MANRCQTCYVTFDSIDALREHIWWYQEAQLHLPPRQHRVPWSQSYRPFCDHCTSWPHYENDTPEGDTSVEPDDENNDNGRDDGEDDPPAPAGKGQTFSCPDPKCNKTFTRIARLLPHFGKHVQCFEICVFCREPFSEAFSFLKHKCQNLKRSTAKKYYMRERHSQLRKYVIDKLARRPQHSPS
ncbi:Uncharacterized protein TCAP_07504 [Tolypocladium capitatum]|uniref:C2H2-type domain-containing protein n=1 Tax=Tolypocladium capitatum TaxID=45235 RepID=A0A2K3PU55_9HYPO|nr:Uncharacterized protein TCAP_07504 [Tolypocladium capitatum]